MLWCLRCLLCQISRELEVDEVSRCGGRRQERYLLDLAGEPQLPPAFCKTSQLPPNILFTAPNLYSASYYTSRWSELVCKARTTHKMKKSFGARRIPRKIGQDDEEEVDNNTSNTSSADAAQAPGKRSPLTSNCILSISDAPRPRSSPLICHRRARSQTTHITLQSQEALLAPPILRPRRGERRQQCWRR